jgi:predicted DsbA family dithiol-disulfide isomerase
MKDDYKSLDDDLILEKASSLGFDRDAFQRKMTDSKVLKRIEQDIKDGKQAGVTGIPTVFINGRKLKKRTLEGFQELIDQGTGLNK